MSPENTTGDPQGSPGQPSAFDWKRSLGILLILAGVLVLVIAVRPEFLGRGGQTGVSAKQIVVGLVGFFSMLSGVVLASPVRRQYIKSWLVRATAPEQQVKPAKLLHMAIWFGLVAGLGEVFIRAFQRFVLHTKYLNPHVFWMIPVADVLLFAAIGLVFSLVAWKVPRLFTRRWSAFFFAFLGFSSLLLIFQPQLHIMAALVLAIGLAVQTSRLVKAHLDQFYVTLRRSMPWLVAVVAAAALSVYAWKIIPEYRALAKLPPATAEAPNVLLIVLDTVRANSLSLYGYSRPTTPELQRFAKTAVNFERALSTSPWTLPSHGSMFTGYYPHQLFASWQTPLDYWTPLDDTHATLAETLSAHGYETSGFVANLVYCSFEHGLHRGFAHYEDYVVSLDAFLDSSSLGHEIYSRYLRANGNQQLRSRKSAADINRAFLDWLSQRKQRPFFAFLNYFDAHDPYIPPQPFDLMFSSKKPSNPYVVVPRDYGPEEIEGLQDAYDGSIAYLDHKIGSLLDELGRRGVLDDTLVIITSDHGEQFGEHGLMTHGNSLYRPLLHVPLIISFPARVPSGKTVHEPVSLRDVPATVVDLVGIEAKASFPGASLSRYWNGDRSQAELEEETYLSELLVGKEKVNWWPESWPIYKGGMKSLVAGGFHYIKNGDGREELYDFDNDPLEQRDLAGTEEGRGVIKQLRTSLGANHGS